MTGGGAFEGDAIALNRGLNATERALGRAGGGLFLLFFGAASAIPTVVLIVYALLFDRPSLRIGTTGGMMMFSVLRELVPALLQCVVGFVLAFALGLRRLVKTP